MLLSGNASSGKKPPIIIHRDKPEKTYQMLRDASRNVGLSKRAVELLRFYASCKSGFRPSTSYIEHKTGIKYRNISYVRSELAERGIIGYGDEFRNMIVVDWNRIKVFASLSDKLIYDKDRASDYFSPVREYSTEAIEIRLYYRTKIKDAYPKIKIVNEPVISNKEKKYWQYIENLTPYECVNHVKSFYEARGVRIYRPMIIKEEKLNLSFGNKTTNNWEFEPDTNVVEYQLPF